MRTLLTFLKQYNYVIMFLFLETMAVLMMVRNSYYQSGKIAECGNRVAGRWYSGVNSVTDYFALKHENDALAAENARLRAALASSYMSYVDRVFVHNDTVYRQKYNYRKASVIKNSWKQQDNILMINMGRHQGIKPQMAVISPQGIVGVVLNTTENFATVMPVLHSNSRNSVKIKRTGSNGTLLWNGNDYRYATVTDIPSTHKLFVNDTIITSGLANDFPEGIMVGFVDKVFTVHGSGIYSIRIRLSTDFNRLDHVYVIENQFRAEQDSLIGATTHL